MDRVVKIAASGGNNRHFIINKDYTVTPTRKGHIFGGKISLGAPLGEDTIGVFTTDNKMGTLSDDLTPLDALYIALKQPKCYCKGAEVPTPDGLEILRRVTCYSYGSGLAEAVATESFIQQVLGISGDLISLMDEYRTFPNELINKYAEGLTLRLLNQDQRSQPTF